MSAPAKNVPAKGARRARLADGSEVVAWNGEAVAARLAAAAETLRALPATGCRPGGLRSQWPSVVAGFWETWNALESEGSRRDFARLRLISRARPTAAEIDAMDEALGWLHFVEDRGDARLLWARALGVRPGRLAAAMGLHRETLRLRYRRALERLVCRLNAGGDGGGACRSRPAP